MSLFTANFDLTAHNTLHLAATATQGFELTSTDQLGIISDWQSSRRPWLVVGEGANMLFSDDIEGLVVLNRLSGRQLIETSDAWYLDVASGENWHELVDWLVHKNICGLENLASIPGTVGAAPVQNIGAYGVEFAQLCDTVCYYDVQTRDYVTLDRKACEFEYRDSIFKQALSGRAVITSVRLVLPKQWQPRLAYGGLNTLSADQQTPVGIFKAVCKIRHEKLPDPKIIGNAGSFFKNPVVSNEVCAALKARFSQMPAYPDGCSTKLAAGWLIDQCGLKGARVGQAQVHPLQALVLTNQGGATAQDILGLARLVRERVMSEFNVMLEPEVRFVGRYGLVAPEFLLEAKHDPL
jgi:UDP-N-acetylmuramate dehydrogenase